MQDWTQLLQRGEGSSMKQAKAYLHKHAAGEDTVQAVMSRQNREQRFWQRGEAFLGYMCVVVRCTCGNVCCLRVVVVDSVRRAIERRTAADPLSCPLHDTNSSTHSHGVQRFHQALEQLQVNAKCVWDWHNVPGNPRMHVDATLLLPTGDARCFEIDSNLHFEPGQHNRLDSDERKDHLFDKAECGMMRLHTFDVESWPQYMHAFLSSKQSRVRYSGAYVHCVNDKSAVMQVDRSDWWCEQRTV